MSFSNEAHVAYVSDSIEVSQPRFVSCSAKRRAERDSFVSFSGEKGRVFLAEPQRAGEILAYPFQKKKATFFLRSHKEPERFLHVHFRIKRPRFPFSCPDPRRFLGESLCILFNIERPILILA